ncbi:hypothetical protein KR093_008182 [Drosophila rubida]|uniref:Uncharacterized protein n=1 Tax=Drosophila rubida TaxID=30044 RepID=A0AAD4PI51_9MUSC|nr:hypothetical protein KR093_008182 [Drosophila rubida]
MLLKSVALLLVIGTALPLESMASNGTINDIPIQTDEDTCDASSLACVAHYVNILDEIENEYEIDLDVCETFTSDEVEKSVCIVIVQQAYVESKSEVYTELNNCVNLLVNLEIPTKVRQ